MPKYFTEKQIEDFKNGSINFPIFLIDREQDEVVMVSEVVRLGGVGDNNGTPTEIAVQVHKVGEMPYTLTYRLDKDSKGS